MKGEGMDGRTDAQIGLWVKRQSNIQRTRES